MKAQIRKIAIFAVAVLIAGTGISFAHDWRGRYPELRGHAYGHQNKKGYDRHGRYERHFKGYRKPWSGYRRFDNRYKYRKYFYRHHHSYHQRNHPSRNRFFFGFSIR